MQGDNLEAIKALLPYYAGKVKCICIDPPFNSNRNYRAFRGGATERRARERTAGMRKAEHEQDL